MKAERTFPCRGYCVRTNRGKYVALLSFRDVTALVACRDGRVRARWRRRHTPFWADEYLEPECDDFGIGYGTISNLQSKAYGPLIATPTEEGPLKLTARGRHVLAAVLALDGAETSL